MRYVRAVFCAAGLVVWPATGLGHPADRSITFAETLLRCKEAPSVRAVAESLRVKRSLDENLGAMVANPQVTVQAGYRNDTGGQGTDVQVSIQQGLNLAGLAKARRRTAELESATLHAEWQATLLQERLGAVRLWSEHRSATVWGRQSGAVGEPGTIQAISSRTMQPKPRLKFLSTAGRLATQSTQHVQQVEGTNRAS